MDKPAETLRITRVVDADKQRVFKAWTDPAQVKKWWKLGEGWTTPAVEVDLKVGGKISLGNAPSGGGLMVVTGEFLQIDAPDKLVYTMRFPGALPEESLVTVEFKDLGGQTEIIITQKMSEAMLDNAVAGWNAALDGLSNLFR